MFIPGEAWHVAVRLLAHRGVLAERHALDRMRALCLRNDMMGFATWAKILAAINELRRTERLDEEREN
ncbi:MAG TPA: hypothetical protein VMA86_12015 [Acetobacteraceae bacterium]|nr:hypothetical protein [Acetobacteraceae bacterium]